MNSKYDSDLNPLLLLSVTIIKEFEKEKRELEIDLTDFESFSDFLCLLSKILRIKITPSRFDLKILYEESWVNLIDVKSFYFFISNDLLLNSQTKIMVLKKEEKKEKEIGFSLTGEKYEDNLAVDSNRPNMRIYDASNPEVFCAFCGDSSKDNYKLQKLGPYYGPVKKGSKRHFFHELCALWSPAIFLDEYGRLQKVAEEIERSRKFICTYCGEKGAGLGCHAKKCKTTYHYLCAKSDGCYLNDQKYNMYCSGHKDQIALEELDNFVTKEIEPEGYSDLLCIECKSGLDEDKILICDLCSFGIHTYCHTPEILEIPKEEFHCYKCLNK
jgi:hypothetical protein